MSALSQSSPARYGIAVLAVILAVGLRLLLDPVLHESFPFATLFFAVLVATWFGGRGPALAATALGVLLAVPFLLPPRGHFAVAGLENQVGLLVYLAVGVGIALLGGSMGDAWRRAEEGAREAARRGEQLRTTLVSIGDAVIVTDAAGRVTAMNRVAETLTGWPAAEAEGRPLDEVFRIRNEFTRRPVESPVPKVLREGNVVGLANHTLLVARDGSERPIDDSAAPVRDGDRLTGVVLVFRDVTERRRSEEARRHLAAIVESSDDAIVGKSLDGVITSWNRAAERLYGYTAEEAVGQSFSLLVPPGHVDPMLALIEQVRRGEPADHYDAVRRRKDGALIEVSANVSPVRDAAGTIVGLSVIARDVTGRRRTERELADFFENAPIGLHWVGQDGTILRANRTELELLGYERDEYVGRNIAEFYVDPVEITDILAVLGRGETLCNREARMRCKDGSVRHVRIDSNVLWQGGRFVHTRCFTRDVTAQKLAEQERLDAESRTRSVVDHVVDGIVTIDEAGTVETFNPAAERLFGYAAAEVIGRNVRELMPEPYRSAHDGYVESYLRTGEAKIIGHGREVVGRRKDGSTFLMDLAVSEFHHGGRRYFTGIVRDVTERKRVEQSLRFLADASATLATLVDYESTLQKVARLAVPEFADWCTVDLVGPDGSLRRVAVAHADPAKVRLAQELGDRYPPDRDAAHGSYHVLRTGRPEMMSEIPDQLLVQGARDAEHLRLMRELGLKSYMSVPLRVRERVLGVVSFVSAESRRRYTAADLTFAAELARRAATAIENAQLYKEVREADRRKEEFLAILAHELRNPLAPIRNALEIMRLPGTDAPTTAWARDMMERQVHHLVRLVDDLLDLSRVLRGKIELRKEWVTLATVVARAVETSQPVIDARGHELTVSVEAEPVLLEADPVRLAQVVSNLLTNAAKYTERGGKIWLTARREGDEVVIRVRDTGIGIAPDMLPQVFGMFVQAKSASSLAQGGLGIGLTLVKTLAEMHGGRVEAHSGGPGRGSEFVVRLRPARPVTEGGEKAEAGKVAAPVRRRVLVVDDHADAANTLAALLRLGGHEVRVVHDGPAALAAAAGERPDVIFLDIGMPGMDGYEVCRQLRRTPGLEDVLVVALTGWGQEEDRRRTREAGFDLHLVKPPEPDTIYEVLRHPRLSGAG